MSYNDRDNPGTYFVPLPRESPAGRQHLHTVQAGATLPLIQALITGIILGGMALTLAWLLGAVDPWNWGAGVAALGSGLYWMSLQRHWLNLTKLENLTGLDLNRDGQVGDRTNYEPERIHVDLSEINDGGHLHITSFDLPANRAQLEALAEGLVTQGLPFSERTWTGSDRPFSLTGFRALRSEMIKRGCLQLASQKSNQQGYILSRAGRAVLRQFIKGSPTTGS